MPLLTIFTAPKPFTNPHIALIQCNAIRSWLALGAEVEVLLIGEEPGLSETAGELGVTHLPQVARNEQGTPLVSSIFALARAHSTRPVLAYINADILLLPDFLAVAQQVQVQQERFLVVGQRWDLDVSASLDFSANYASRLQAELSQKGKLHPPAGSDYFIFPHALFQDMPPFAIGRAGWDNWMIYHAHQMGWPVIDATPSIHIIHQNHDYSHLPGGKPHYDLEESGRNVELAGGEGHMYMVLDANRQFRGGRLALPLPSLPRLLRKGELWLAPRDGRRTGRQWAVARQLRRWRRQLTKARQ